MIESQSGPGRCPLWGGEVSHANPKSSMLLTLYSLHGAVPGLASTDAQRSLRVAPTLQPLLTERVQETPGGGRELQRKSFGSCDNDNSASELVLWLKGKGSRCNNVVIESYNATCHFIWNKINRRIERPIILRSQGAFTARSGVGDSAWFCDNSDLWSRERYLLAAPRHATLYCAGLHADPIGLNLVSTICLAAHYRDAGN
ncbi:hypothetical protein J6590_045886 [Homalodisca vitripennis]|nr:hypothetical protein J6590_045886 [Homalodisca vitripennis]